MKNLIAKFLQLGTLALLVTGPLSPVRAQSTPPPEVIKKQVKTQLNPGMFRVQNRPAIPFKPFEMRDPNTNKTIASTATITLTDGKTLTANEYYGELDSLERWLNGHGYSLRTPPNEEKIMIQEIPVNGSLLQRQTGSAPKPTSLPRKANILAAYSYANLSQISPLPVAKAGIQLETVKVTESANKVSAAGIHGAVRDGMVISTSSLARIAALLGSISPGTTGTVRQPDPCPQIGHSQPFNWNLGENSKFAAYVDGYIAVSGNVCKPPDMANFKDNQSSFSVRAEGKAGGAIFGNKEEMLRVTGDFDGYATNNTVSANLGVFVLGQDVLSINKTANDGWGIDDQISKNVDFSTSTTLPLGPVDIDVTVGTQGPVGFRYSLFLVPTFINVSGGPFAHTKIYAQTGVDVFKVAEVGVGVNMTLLNWDMNFVGSAGIGWSPTGYLAYDDIYADTNLDMLDGKLYVYAKVGVGPFEKELQTDLWSWSGYQYNSVLVNHNDVTPLNW